MPAHAAADMLSSALFLDGEGGLVDLTQSRTDLVRNQVGGGGGAVYVWVATADPTQCP